MGSDSCSCAPKSTIAYCVRRGTVLVVQKAEPVVKDHVLMLGGRAQGNSGEVERKREGEMRRRGKQTVRHIFPNCQSFAENPSWFLYEGLL